MTRARLPTLRALGLRGVPVHELGNGCVRLGLTPRRLLKQLAELDLLADDLGSGGSQTTTVYPEDQGATYHLEVDSECSWSTTLTSG